MQEMSENLKTHVDTVHKKLKDFVCYFCQKLFGLKGTLQNHFKAVHEQIKDFHCKVCLKSFGRNKSFQRHFFHNNY